VYPNLKLQIWRSGLRQNRFAQLAEVDETMLSRILNGYRLPSPELRKRIAELLAADEEWLFQPTSNPVLPRLSLKPTGPINSD
jgi:transcriptional regulator with XRE-family HTH domain